MSPDRVAAWATAVGVGLVTVMVTWLVGNQVTGLVWDRPLGPSLAFAGAVVIGTVTAVISGRQLSRRLTDERARDAHRRS